MKIVIEKFGGIAPRYSENLKFHMAEEAEDVDLSRFTLRPWREPLQVSNLIGQSIWHEDCCFLADQSCETSYAYKGLECTFLFATGMTGYPYPVIGKFEDCNLDICRLGFPCDLPPPTVVQTLPPPPYVEGQTRFETVAYVYTLVDKYGNESMPSEISDFVDYYSGAVFISGWPTNFSGYCVERIRIYRTQSEMTYGAETASNSTGNFFRVADLNILTPGVVDGGGIIEGALTTIEYGPPPDDLRQITYWREGQLAGLSGNRLVFSEQNRYHAWPDKYAVMFHDKPLKFLSGRTTGFVLTDGHPAVVKMRHECKGSGCHDVYELEDSHPIISVRSAVVYNDHAVYASKDGLIMLSANGQAKHILAEYYSKDQWMALKPWTMFAAIHDGHYYGFFEDHAIRFRLPDGIYESQGDIALTTLSMRPISAYRSDNDELYLGFADGIYRWNAANTFMNYNWRSAKITMPGIVRMTAYKVCCTQSVIIDHWVNDTLQHSFNVLNQYPQRLPLCAKGIDWNVQFSGQYEVSRYMLATSIADLAGGAVT